MKTNKLLLLLLAIKIVSDDSNQGKNLEWQLNISLAKDYGQKFVQQLKTIICVAVLGGKAISIFKWL